MLILFSSLILHAAGTPSVLNNALYRQDEFQSLSGVLLGERHSEQSKRAVKSVAASHRADASEHRVADRRRAHTHWQNFNASVGHATRVASLPIRRAAPPKPTAIPTATQTVVAFEADVRVRVRDERGRPIGGRTVLVSLTRGDQAVAFDHGRAGWLASRGGAGYAANVASLPVKDGFVEIKGVPVPAAISIRLPDGVSDEWSIVGDEGAGAVVIGDGTKAEEGTVAILPTASGPIISKSADPPKLTTLTGISQKVKLTVRRETRRVNVEMPETVTLRREVADFVVPKPTVASTERSAKAHLFLGQEKEGNAGFSPQSDGENWAFQVRRNDLGDDSKLIVQTDTVNGSFGGEIALGKVNFYEPNRLPQAPTLELEAIANPKIVFAGKTVDDSFRLSPIQWRSEGGGRPVLMTGKDALATLGASESDARVVTPDGGDKDNRGNFGQWLFLDRLGLALHCRFDPDQKGKDKPLPDIKIHGLLEAVRVTSEAGGKVGDALYVGADRKAVEAAFGRPDPAIEHLDQIKLGEAAKTVYGDARIEAPAETYLYGGLRIGYRDDKVAWFEIARPIQLLYDGARAFVPEQARTVAIGDVGGEPAFAADALRSALRDAANGISGMRLVEGAERADYVLTGHVSASASVGQAQHTYSVKESYTDSKGKEKTRYKTYNEGFKCDEASGSAAIDVELRDAKAQTSTPIKGIGGLTFTEADHHKAGERCQADPDGLLREKVTSGAIAKQIRRPLGKVGSDESNILGTVIAVNYETGRMLINLGERQGVHSKREGSEGTELTLILTHNVDLKTGVPVDIKDAPVLAGEAHGQKRDEWLEVQSVGDDWCVAQLKKKKGGKTHTANDEVARLVDPGSGLLRVRISEKRGKK